MTDRCSLHITLTETQSLELIALSKRFGNSRSGTLRLWARGKK
jgi:hypothetical protein